jgi:hypothetical protein
VNASSPDNARPADWADVLNRIHQSLEQALANVPPPSETDEVSSRSLLGDDTTERLRQRLAQVEERANHAKQNGQQLEALLTFEIESLNAWLAQSSELGQRLRRAIG